jgi:uncharacterized membrane protein
MSSETGSGRRFLGARIRYKNTAESYWFRPILLLVFGILLSQITLFIDETIHNFGFDLVNLLWFILKLTPVDSAGSFLGSTATVLLGLFGVLLSLALIPLTIATSSYGNVILRNFLRDKGTQNVIGFFALVIFFDLFAAVSLPLAITLDNYPGVTLTTSMLLLAAALVVTIYFFNHVANLLQATYITKSVTGELMEELENQYLMSQLEFNEEKRIEFDNLRQDISTNGSLIRSAGHGYVTGLNYQHVFNIAARAGTTVLILKLPGDYVSQNEPLAKCMAKEPARPKSIARKLNSAYYFGVNRTVMQDIDYGVQLLATIASRALSPAVNDPITANICIDKIGQVMSKVVSQPVRSPYYTDNSGTLRLIADPDDFRSLMATGFNQIRQYGNKAYEVMCQVLYAFETIAYAAQRESDRKIIKEHADLILEEALNNLTSEWSKQQVWNAYNSAIKVIESK